MQSTCTRTSIKMTTECCEKAMKDHVSRLKKLSRQHIGSELSKEAHSLVTELKSSVLRHATPTHAFCNLGGPQLLLQLLTQCACAGKDAVLLLGLLGNLCALDKNTRDVVMTDHKFIVKILSDTTQCDVLNTSARLVANLALDISNISLLLAEGVVHLLLVSLARGSNACKRSVLRALRLLAASGDCRNEVNSVNGVEVVAECLQSCDSHVMSAAIQTLQAVTKESTCESMVVLCNKATLQLIIRHCHHTETAVCESAVNLLLSTAKHSEGRVALSNAGGLETLVGLMEKYEKQRGMLREVVCAVCLCCSNALSRQRLRDSGGLKRLIEMLASDSYFSLHGNILSALIYYYFDEVSLKAMVSNTGLLKALVSHLNREADDVPAIDCEGNSDESSTPSSSLQSAVDFDSPGTSILTPVDIAPVRQRNPLSQQAELKLPLLQMEDFDPVATPLPSKKSRLEVDFESSMPVPPNFIDSLLSSPSPYAVEEKLSPSAPLPQPLRYQVIQLLSRVSHLKDCLPLLSSPDILSPIIWSLTSTDPPNLHVFKVLVRVFTNPHCFQDVLLSLAPSKLQQHLCEEEEEDKMERSLSQQCWELLNRLSKVAESPYGQGVLAHMLLRGDLEERQASCLSLPILCRSVRVCKSLMLTHGGFHELSQLVYSENDLHSLALDSMLALAINTHQFTSYQPVLPGPPPSKYCHYIDSDHSPFDLVLVVCGGGECACVPVHRRVMVEASDVFRVMLEGGYKEGGQDKVTLQDIPPRSFVSVVHHLYGCGWQCAQVHTLTISQSTEEMPGASMDIIHSIASCVCKDQEKAALCLSVMVCAGRFFLTDLTTLCQHTAVQYVLPSNIVEMLYFATMHQCYCLSESCIRVVMAMGKLRKKVFRDLLTSFVRDTVLSMLRMFLSVS